MKVKIFEFNLDKLELMEEAINDFIVDKKIVDIRYNSAGENCSYWSSALILYE